MSTLLHQTLNDIILLKQRGNDSTSSILSKPLRPDSKIQTVRGSVATNDVIGKRPRDLVVSKKGVSYRVLQPSLAEYTSLSPRVVTPIYPQDANLIVSLLDLHPTVPSEGDPVKGDRLEIFEAGTGHGALTLHLARAIHGANRKAPRTPPPEKGDKSSEGGEILKRPRRGIFRKLATVFQGFFTPNFLPDPTGKQAVAEREAYDAWRSKRRAVIHSLDSSLKHSAHAQQTVKNFRHGIYYPHIDFHIGSIDDYLSTRLSQNREPFLDHAILDLPGTHKYMDIVSKALKPDGTLITFCPSITQINSGVLLVKDKRLPFLIESVLEIGAGIGVGGREWDVRPVKPRALLRAEQEARKLNAEGAKVSEEEGESTEGEATGRSEQSEEDTSESSISEDSGWEMVCRPKVGMRTTGGGFIAVWRRMERN
ncbi:hypothetical protein B7494_g2597 [Chlorociboria aeruginascens]|nr:hypothetical protein B7494_g2597 [Chlorociboria aeruginascens]